MTAGSTSHRPRRQILAASALVVVACALVYGQAVGYHFVNWDDDLHVVQNDSVSAPLQVPLQRHLLTPYLGYPIPVTVASYSVDHALFGMDPHGFHLTNLLLHVLASLVVLAVALKLGAGTWVAAACALLFAVHPAVGEPVSWVSGRKDLLAGLFSLLAVLAFLRIPDDDRGIRARLPIVLLVLMGALSKPSALLVPGLFLALDFRRGRCAWLWVVVLAAHAGLAALAVRLESDVGALGGAAGQGTAERVLAGAGWLARIVFWPFDLMPKYLDPVDGTTTLVLVAGAVSTAALAGALAVATWRGHPARVGLALAALAHLPQSGVLPLSRQYANAYAYLPLAGLALAVAATVGPTLSTVAPRVRAAAAVAALVCLAALGLAANAQALVYQDGVTLWSTVYRKYPDSPQVCRNLGNAYLYEDRDEPASAVRVYEHCIRTLGNRPFYLKNLAIASFKAAQFDEAGALFDEYRQVHGPDPTVDKYVEAIRRATESGR